MALLETSRIESALRDSEDHYVAARPDWTKLKPTTDQGRYFDRDAISESLIATGATNLGSLTSKNVKAPKNGRKAAKAQLGVSGGYVAGAKGDRTIDRAAHRATIANRRAKRNARIAANRARKAAIIAELRSRGYAV